jgi:fructoselysine 6-kinase
MPNLETTKDQTLHLIVEGETLSYPVVISFAHIDTLGARDTFIARTLVGLLQVENPSEALEAATQVAAETSTRTGAVGHPAAMAVNAGNIPALEDVR